MQKKVVAVAVIGVLASGIVGANFYADHRLKSYYQEQKNNMSMFQREQSQINMGLLSGEAHWSYKIVPNPCQPQHLFVIKGVDHIQRSWYGYHIQSDINIDLQGKQAEVYQWLLKNQSLLKLDSKLTWLGNIDMQVKAPSVSHETDDLQMVWNGLDGVLKLKKDKDQYYVTQADLNMPSFTLRNGSNYFSVQGMHFVSDQGLFGQTLRSGKSEFSIQKLIFLNQNVRHKANIEFSKLKFNSEIDVQEKDTALKMNASSEEMMFDMQKLNNIQFNIHYSGLDTAALQNIVQFANQDKAMVCENNMSNMQQEIQTQMLKLFEHGFSFESKDNQLEFGGAKMTANLNGKLLPNNYANLQEINQKLANSTQLEFNTTVDKKFLRNMMVAMGKMPSGVSDQDYDRGIEQVAQMMHAKVNGNSIDFSMKYANGQTTYP